MNNQKSRKQRPAIIIIWGATGDLSRGKLIPALLDLYCKGNLPKKILIIGISRRDYTDEIFREFLKKESISKKRHGHSRAKVSEFLSKITYSQGMFEEKETYKRLEEKVFDLEKKLNTCADKSFYLAVHPDSYKTILKNLSLSSLAIPCGGDLGWSRVLIEKPFGNDVETAKKLDDTLGTLFKEEQIFRIDHYLAKEALQNILVFRFSNAIFEPLWNKKYIEKVEIKMLEDKGLAGRGFFYDRVGALRDVGQNHLLQMLALVAMEKPKEFSARHIRQERAKALEKLELIKDVKKQAVRGQFEGFLSEKGVREKSQTETYFKIKAFLKNPKWKGVPFYLESGKELKKGEAYINVYFKSPSEKNTKSGIECFPNVLTFRIQPKEGIDISFWTKVPGFKNKTERKTLSFSYKHNKSNIPNAYEKVLYDCLHGDQTLFASTEEIQASWKFITPIIKQWQKLPLHKYKKGAELDFDI